MLHITGKKNIKVHKGHLENKWVGNQVWDKELLMSASLEENSCSDVQKIMSFKIHI